MPVAGSPRSAADAVAAAQEPSTTGDSAPPPDAAAQEQQRRRLARLFRKYGDDAASHVLWRAIHDYRFGPQEK